MPVIIDATPGGPTANSYETLAEAELYFASRLPVAGWAAATDPTKNILLVMATRTLDALAQPFKTLVPAQGGVAAYYRVRRQWTGVAATATQALSWPRIGMYDMNGNAIAETIVPQALKDAQSELAGALSNADLTLNNDVIVQGLTSVKAGSVALTFKDNIIPQVIPDMVYNLMPLGWLTDELVEQAVPAFFEVASCASRPWGRGRF